MSTIKLRDTKLLDTIRYGSYEGTVILKSGTLVYIASNNTLTQGWLPLTSEHKSQWKLAENFSCYTYWDVNPNVEILPSIVGAAKVPNKLSDAKLGDKVGMLTLNGSLQVGDGNLGKHESEFVAIEGTIVAIIGSQTTIGFGNGIKPKQISTLEVQDFSGHKYQRVCDSTAPCYFVKDSAQSGAIELKRITECQLGDMVEVFVDNNEISATKTNTSFRGILIAQPISGKSEHYYIGSTGESQYPSCSGYWKRTGSSDSSHTYLDNQKDFLHGYSIPSSTMVRVIGTKSSPKQETKNAPDIEGRITPDSIRKIIEPLLREQEAKFKQITDAHDQSIKAITAASKEKSVELDNEKLKGLLAKAQDAFFRNNFRPGDRVKALFATNIVDPTVVGVVSTQGRSVILLAWKDAEKAMIEASQNYCLYSGEEMVCLPDIQDYHHYLAVMPQDASLLMLSCPAPESTKTISVKYGDALAIKDTTLSKSDQAEPSMMENEAEPSENAEGGSPSPWMIGAAVLGGLASAFIQETKLADVRVAESIESIETLTETVMEASNG